MDFSDYFLKELKALRETGKAFALEHPRLAAFLSEEGQDPDVERILESVAFLTARLQQRLDGVFADVTHELLRLAWPGQLQVTPSMTMVAFEAGDAVGESRVIARGAALTSIPVDGHPCRFRTCREVALHPWRLAGCRHMRTETADELVLDLHVLNPAFLLSGGPDALSLYLHGDARQTGYWLQHLERDVLSLGVSLNDGAPEWGAVTVEPEGFDEGFQLLPDEASVASGLRLASEYFLYPEKFSFVALKGLRAFWSRWPAEALECAERIRLTLRFSKRTRQAFQDVSQLVQLHVSPAINLFECDARPLDIEHLESRYLLQPDTVVPGVQAHSVVHLEGWNRDTRRYRSYAPLSQALESCHFQEQGTYYWEKCLPSQVSHYQWQLWTGFYGEGRQALMPQREVIHARLRCTDGMRARKLGVGDVCYPAEALTALVSARNITPVTPPLFPYLHGHRIYELLGLLRSSVSRYSSREALIETLKVLDRRSHYDRAHSEAIHKKIQGVLSLRCREALALRRGIPVMGREIVLEVDESRFLGDGDIHLFGAVLYALMAGGRRINEHLSLRLVGHKHQGIWEWG